MNEIDWAEINGNIKRELADLVLTQMRLKRELMELARRAGHAQNAVDLNTSVSGLAADEVAKLTDDFLTKLNQYIQNERAKTLLRCDIIRNEFIIQTS
jgi:hypothetical protein